MEKKLLIVANWKANKTVQEADQWLRGLSQQEAKIDEYIGAGEVAIASPTTTIPFLFESLTKYGLGSLILASQDVSIYPAGPYTGETPAELLVDLGVRYCLIGHSERRKFFRETNLEVEAKMGQAVKLGITPIICAQEISEIPTNIRNYQPNQYVVMYEPFEAISTEGEYHAEKPERVEAKLEDFKKKLNLQCRLLYGGSVNPENAAVFAQLPSVSGFVVGHASLDPQEFFSIIEQCFLKTSPH